MGADGMTSASHREVVSDRVITHSISGREEMIKPYSTAYSCSGRPRRRKARGAQRKLSQGVGATRETSGNSAGKSEVS